MEREAERYGGFEGIRKLSGRLHGCRAICTAASFTPGNVVYSSTSPFILVSSPITGLSQEGERVVLRADLRGEAARKWRDLKKHYGVEADSELARLLITKSHRQIFGEKK